MIEFVYHYERLCITVCLTSMLMQGNLLNHLIHQNFSFCYHKQQELRKLQENSSMCDQSEAVHVTDISSAISPYPQISEFLNFQYKTDRAGNQINSHQVTPWPVSMSLPLDSDLYCPLLVLIASKGAVCL